ncbi:MAG: hypothetical protein IKY31_08150 [Bacteroidaceae bacterium]|nr:hypothetical protein [Bacteroidaceae bacterium]
MDYFREDGNTLNKVADALNKRADVAHAVELRKIVKEQDIREQNKLINEFREWLTSEYKISGTSYISIEDQRYIIDIEGNVSIKNKNSRRLFKDVNAEFRKVSGNFDISKCKIEDLYGCPKEVGGDFTCQGCKSLRSTKGFPKKVSGKYTFTDCPNLKDYTDAPCGNLIEICNTALQKFKNWKSRV